MLRYGVYRQFICAYRCAPNEPGGEPYHAAPATTTSPLGAVTDVRRHVLTDHCGEFAFDPDASMPFYSSSWI